MKKYILGLLTIIVLFPISGFNKTKSGPKLKELKPPVIKTIGGDEFDFHNVQKGQTIYHTFEFYNTGEKSMNIDQVISYCKCISVSYDVEPILPGMKGSIRVKLNTNELKGDITKEIYILSNAQTPLKEPRYTLYLKGTVLTQKDYTDKW